MDKEWVRRSVEGALEGIYGAPHGSVAEVVEATFAPAPTLQFRGHRDLHPLFGCVQGGEGVRKHFEAFFAAVEVTRFNKQFVVVDGLGASAHYDAQFRMKGSGSTCDLELVALVDLDLDGRLRDLKLYFDTATFLKAVTAPNASFTDVRAELPHPAFDPDSRASGGAAMARVYDAFLKLGAGQATWEEFYDLFADDMEVAFKANVDVVPYAGQYAGKEGFQRFFRNLFSIFSVGTMDFAKVYAEGNQADCWLQEPHYYANPDGSKRYLEIHIVQSWRVDERGKMHLFKSYNDSAWLDEAFKASRVYGTHYGYPEGYPQEEVAHGHDVEELAPAPTGSP